jgi:aryl-phospho-beta-D-glucosidase BglC (GH1 family)
MKRNEVRARWRPALVEQLEARRLLTAIVADPSFESPSVSANSYAYNPTGSVWTFSSTSGVVNSPSSLDAPAAPNGQQVAFLQTNRSAAQYNGTEDGTISQSISLPSSGYYALSLDAAADVNDVGASYAAEESFMVTLNGTPVLTGLHPTRSTFTSIGGTFYAGAGTQTLALVSTGPDSTTTFIDEVQLTAVVPGAATQVVLLTVPQSLATGVASSAITVQLENASGLAVDAGSGGVAVNLSTTSNQGRFLNGGGVLTTAVTIPTGSSTTTFTYTDGSAGTPTLTASASGLTSATQQETVQTVTSSSFLHTSGTNIVNGSGQTVLLRGVNLGSWLTMEGWMSPLDSSGLPDEYGVIQTLDDRFGVAEEQSLIKTYQQNWITVQDLQNIKNAGFNVIRVPVWWGDFETLQGQWRSDAFAELDWLVNTAGAMGIYTIIDMHGVVGGQSTSDDTGQANLDNYWTSSYDQQQTNILMENIALHYKNNPMVAGYDLMNEPDNAPSDAAVIAAYDRLYSAVRSVDANHIAIIEGTFDQWDWSMLPSPASQGWTDVVYEMHEYQWNDTDNPAGVESGTNNQVSDFRNHASYDVPDYIGEFNDFGTGSSTWQYTLEQYDENGISWSFWSYKATDGLVSTQDSWGLYDPVNTLAVPNIQTNPASTIEQDWSNVTTAGSFAINPMLQSALQGAGVTPVNATVANQYMFYYHSSAFDGGATSPSSADYSAIAENANGTDKTALLPGQTATFANVSSYSDGINGILIDFAYLPTGVTFTASDFAFAVGNNNTPSTWSAAPAPTAVATWAGPNGDTFADITWANNAIQEEWLQVTVLADANTHLASNDVFYFGSLIGATGTSTADNGTVLQVTAADLVATQNNASLLSSVPISSLYDLNRDGYVTAADFVLCQDNATLLGGLNLITPGSTSNAVVAGSGVVAAVSGSTTAALSSSPPLDDPTTLTATVLKQNEDPLGRVVRHGSH